MAEELNNRQYRRKPSIFEKFFGATSDENRAALQKTAIFLLWFTGTVISLAIAYAIAVGEIDITTWSFNWGGTNP